MEKPTRLKQWSLLENLRLADAPATAYLLLFTILYLPPTLWLANYKLLWDDEFFTLYLARIPSWHGLIQALSTGADQHPPSFYYLTHLFIKVFGANHIGLRLPSVLGFWLLCVCLFYLIRPMTGPLWAFVGMVFPATTKLYYYATEARGYGLVVGFTALAVLAWFRATDHHRRKLFLPLLGISLFGAVASHYYAGAVLACLVAGEATRTWYTRRIDVPIWCAFVGGVLPIALFFPLIRSARGYSTHFWAVPHWGDAFSFYRTEFSPIVALLSIVALLLFLDLNFNIRGARNLPVAGRPLKRWHAVAILGLCAIPVMVMLVAKSVTHGFSDRYAIASVVGLTVLFTHLIYRLESHRYVAIVLMVSCIALYLYQIRDWHGQFKERKSLLNEAYANLRTVDPRQEIVVMDITLFHQLSYYAPRNVASRIVYLADPTASIKYLGHDTIDRGLLDLSPWFPLRVIPITTYVTGKQDLLAYGSIHGWSWLTFDLPKYGNSRLVARTGTSLLLFEVQGSHALHGLTTFDRDYPESKMLFRSLPPQGPSLCELYSSARFCPVLNPIVPEPVGVSE